MKKIAIISDIHGNLTALKTVLEDIEKRGIKTIYCLGDIIAKGVNPSECLQLVKEKCEIILRGNCDEIMCSGIDECEGIEKERRVWNKSMLTSDEIKYLLNLPYSYEFYMSGNLVRLFHATPTKINDFISNLDSIDKKRLLFLPSDKTQSQDLADVIIYGHTHTAYLEKLYNRTIINIGSVGNSIDVIRNENFDGNVEATTQANYLIIEGEDESLIHKNSISFQFVSIPYDKEKELSCNKKNIEKDDYVTEIIEGKYRDMEKLKKSFKERNIDIDKF